MENSIKDFIKQAEFNPVIVNPFEKDIPYKNFVLLGMGGSHLSGILAKILIPGINLYVHRDYGLPNYENEFWQETLVIASSYSGNTEEILDGAEEAYARGLKICVIAKGGKLLDFAKKNNLSYIALAESSIQPRMAIIYSLLSILAYIKPELISPVQENISNMNFEGLSKEGKDIALSLGQRMPIIYVSRKNRGLGYIWKINFNETAKRFAYMNSFPELNHNELESYDGNQVIKMADNIHVLILKDETDHDRVIKRMDITEALLEDRNIPVTTLFLEGETDFSRTLRSIILSYWIVYWLATFDGVEPEAVHLIEEFKKRMIE
jgi:glucose/mannose-6-phosphate isomerase